MAMCMRILGANHLQGLGRQSLGEDASAVMAWWGEVRLAEWRSEADLLQRFPSALTHDPDHVLFKLSKGGHCMLVRVNYQLRLVLIEKFGPSSEITWPPAGSQKKRVRS